MKKMFSVLLAVFLVFILSSCSVVPVVEPTEEQASETATEEITPVATVKTVKEDERLYYCEECDGECSFYVGQFACPAIDSTSEDAETINAAISDAYDKYLAHAKSAGESGLAYGFTYSVFENENYLVIRTAVATVMLHAGGTYSYDFYYYDLENDCIADVSDICGIFDFDADVLASFVRLELADSGDYSEAQIASVTADDVDIFPIDDSYYVRVQNDQVKYEAEIKGSDLNARGDAIAEEMATEEPENEDETDENGDPVTEETESETEESTSEKDVIYADRDNDRYR